MSILLIIIICVLVLVCAWQLYKFIKKHFKKNPKTKLQRKDKQKENLLKRKDISLEVISSYIPRRDLLFWKFLNTILPKEFVACTKVAINGIVNPVGNKNTYNHLVGKFVDFVIFDESSMRPLLIIDIYDNSYSDDKMDNVDPITYEILQKLQFQILQLEIKPNFDRDDAKKQIFAKLHIYTNEEKKLDKPIE